MGIRFVGVGIVGIVRGCCHLVCFPDIVVRVFNMMDSERGGEKEKEMLKFLKF